MPVKRALKKLGSDINEARRRRRISTITMAQEAMISRPTLTRVERGDASVSLGIYGTVLFVLGMTERLADIADVVHDRVGLDFDSTLLPKRIGSSKRGKGRKHS
jgi:transcriptional regulator with XRE-family HTH domain